LWVIRLDLRTRMGKLNIKESIEVKASLLRGWEIIDSNFVGISVWGRGGNKPWENENVTTSIIGSL